jgi:hypothetical protein
MIANQEWFEGNNTYGHALSLAKRLEWVLDNDFTLNRNSDMGCLLIKIQELITKWEMRECE